MTNNVEVAGTAVLPDSAKAAPHAKPDGAQERNAQLRPAATLISNWSVTVGRSGIFWFCTVSAARSRSLRLLCWLAVTSSRNP